MVCCLVPGCVGLPREAGKLRREDDESIRTIGGELLALPSGPMRMLSVSFTISTPAPPGLSMIPLLGATPVEPLAAQIRLRFAGGSATGRVQYAAQLEGVSRPG